MVSRRTAACAVLALATWSSAASAQTASDRETARSLMDEGFQRREKGDHKGAFERFEAADALMHVPTTGIEAARERIALGQLIEARESLSAVIRYPIRSGEPAPFGEARMQAQRLDDELGARIPSLKIVVRGLEAGGAVTVDGGEVPMATLIAPRRVNPGTHTVVARSGGREKKEQITLRERESRELVIEIPAAPAPSPSPPPAANPDNGGATRDGESKGPDASKILMWGGFGLAGVGAIVGTITGVVSLSAANAAKSGCTADNKCPPPTYPDIDKARTFGTVATVSFIGAGVFAVVGLVGVVISKPEHKTETALTPWIGPGSAGLTGTF